MTKPLDEILAGGEAVSEGQQGQDEQVTQVLGVQEQAEGQTEATQEGQQDRQKMVPHEALHAEKQKVKRYTEEVAEFRRSNETLQRQVSELLQRVPVQKQEQQKAPEWFDDPAAATRHYVGEQVSPQIENLNQALLSMARDNAILRYDEEKVVAAEQAFLQAMQSNRLDQADYQKVVGSPNRYAAAVQWHQRQLAQAEIGDDPAAFRAKVEAELRAKILEEHGLTKDGQPVQQRPTVMPSNLAGARNVGTRAGPAWSGPRPIGDIIGQK